MLDIVDVEKLKSAAVDLYRVAGINTVLYNTEGKLLISYPKGLCRFCREVRKNPALKEQCLHCDQVGFETCRQTKEQFIYRCHMGLTEAIAPVCDNGIVIGYMMFGQVLCKGDRARLLAKIEQAARRGQVDRNVLLADLETVPEIHRSAISSIINIMRMCARYLWTSQIITVRNDTLVYHLNHYINENLAGDLSLDAICAHLYLSRSKLYKLSRSAFQMGISDYIRAQRLQKAKELLQTKKYKITEVAKQVGIPDANYFTRFFKKETGLSPKEWLAAQ